MATSQPPSAAAVALRESFGDRKLPDISRKITACVACRKQKIKCYMNNSQPPCTRCRKRDLPCTVNKSLQMLLESDISWKDSMEERLQRIEQMLDPSTSSSSALQEPNIDTTHGPLLQNRSYNVEARDNSTATSNQSSDQLSQNWEVIMDSTRGPGAIPASCVTEVSKTSPAGRHSRTHGGGSDLISRGTVSLADAEKYFDLYRHHLDHFVYNILPPQETFASVRARSHLLVAVICAVSALYAASGEYELCYQAFRDELHARVFAKDHSFDDVRALIIGAFWLRDMSWSLVGIAVNIATDISLHRCITKIPHVKKACYVRTRLYFLVYVCDHHFSIAYGRPPMTQEFDSLSAPMAFLDSEFATKDDARLVSQLEIWSVSSRILETFWLDFEMRVPGRLLPQLQRLSIALDTWRADWNDRFSRIDNCYKRDVGLHFHFAKLYLYSHTFRGPQPESGPVELAAEMQEFANAATFSASSILRIVVNEHDVQASLSSLPTYYDTMIAFAAVFLLKLVLKTPFSVRIDREEVISQIEQLSIVLKDVTTKMHPQHLLSNIGASIGKVLERTRQSTTVPPTLLAAPVVPDQLAVPPADQDWLINPSDSMFLGNYDFLWPQDTDLDFDIPNFNPMPPPPV